MELPYIPPEVLSSILQMMDTPQDLISVIIALPLFKAAFYHAPAFYLGIVLRRAIEPAAEPHALAYCHMATQAMDPEARLAALNSYFAHYDYRLPADMEGLTVLSRLYNRVSYFVDDFASRAIRTSTGNPWTLNDEDRPLAPAERARFQRAFFRHEIYCFVFPLQYQEGLRRRRHPALDTHGEDDSDDSEVEDPVEDPVQAPVAVQLPIIANNRDDLDFRLSQRLDLGLQPLTAIESRHLLFLFNLPAWEIEEMNCVYSYLGDLARESFIEFENQFVKAATSASSVASTNAEDDGLVGFDNLSTTHLQNFTQNNTHTLLGSGFTALIMKGLSFMHQLALSDDDQRRDMLTRFDWASWDILPEERIVALTFDVPPGLPNRMTFDFSAQVGGDDPSYASAGYSRFLSRPQPSADIKLLQERASVFWLAGRVEELGLSLERPDELSSVRSHVVLSQVYVEERLAGVRVTRAQMERLEKDFGRPRAPESESE